MVRFFPIKKQKVQLKSVSKHQKVRLKSVFKQQKVRLKNVNTPAQCNVRGVTKYCKPLQTFFEKTK